MPDRNAESYRVLCEMSKTLKDISHMLKKISDNMRDEHLRVVKESKRDQIIETMKTIPEDRKDPSEVIKRILAS